MLIVDTFELISDLLDKDYVVIAGTHGIVLGYNDKEFGLDDLINRQ